MGSVMNRNRFFLMCLTLFLLSVLFFLGGCGGGFRGDSPNAVEIEDPVFGGDSL